MIYKQEPEYDFIFRALCSRGTPSTSATTSVTASTEGGSIPQTVTLSAIEDAYVQISNSLNNKLLRAEQGNRTSYIKFDVSPIIHPNPAKDKITISKFAKNNRVAIIDVSGRVFEIKLASDQENTNLDISNLKSGIYFITIQNRSKQKTVRFIKN